MNARNSALLFCFLYFCFSCVDHDFPSLGLFECTSAEEVSYMDDVQPLVATKCAIASCHDGTLGAERNWTVLQTLQGKAASVRDRITRPPGTPGHMPAAGSLTREQITTLVCWVEQGAQGN
jgi:hypothetical protein